jgi:hypothetical protein
MLPATLHLNPRATRGRVPNVMIAHQLENAPDRLALICGDQTEASPN